MIYTDQPLKTLLGNSIALPEYEYDDDPSTLGVRDVEDSADIQYCMQSVISAIKTDEFKETFLMMLNEIENKCTFEERRDFCIQILQAVENIYNFSLPYNFEILQEKDIWNVYNFISFLEYNHERFLVRIWKKINPDIKNFDIDAEIYLNKENILNEIERESKDFIFSTLIQQFLQTYDADLLIKWFSEISRKNKTSIIFELSRYQEGKE